MDLYFRRSNALIKGMFYRGEWKLVEKTVDGMCTLINRKNKEAKRKSEDELMPVLLKNI